MHGSPLISLQAISRRLSQERKTLNLWPHSSVIAALPKPEETWVPSAEVGKSGHHHTQHLPSVFWVEGPEEGSSGAQAFLSTGWQHSPQASWPGFSVLQKGYKTSLVSFLPGSLSPSQAHQGDSCLSLASSGRKGPLSIPAPVPLWQVGKMDKGDNPELRPICQGQRKVDPFFLHLLSFIS